jgi:hypothetical protein
MNISRMPTMSFVTARLDQVGMMARFFALIAGGDVAEDLGWGKAARAAARRAARDRFADYVLWACAVDATTGQPMFPRGVADLDALDERDRVRWRLAALDWIDATPMLRNTLAGVWRRPWMCL